MVAHRGGVVSETKVLKSVKKVLGLADDYDVFDPDIIMHINSVLSTLNQLGIGPPQGFAIEGDADTWDSFLEGDPRLNNVKTYVCLRVRMIFDPPDRSFIVTAYQDQIKELEWRINAQREDEQWTPPVVLPIV
jgi:hypothetical protein